ncbi:MAG TPA: TonB-dependent receptor plug domain-containing protein, partial [Chitinophagaceae bacterium]|nr:TonB-dependent receptor plug domain-containing protein [Chitinophagaceae bacterium]
MKKIYLLLVMLVFYKVYSQQTGSLSGTIKSSSDEGVLAGATIAVKGLKLSTLTDVKGRFEITGLAAGTYKVLITHVGYELLELSVMVIANQELSLTARLNRDERIGSEVVITASRRPEKITNAPASIQVLTTRDFDRFAGSNVNEMVATIQGVEYTRTGIEGITFNARGFNSAFNNKTLQLVDGRISMAALSGSLPIFNNGTYMKNDLEKIEIVLGPQTALYGPNAHNAVFNVITKDPRKYPGTIASQSAGNHYQFSSRLRHAEVINKRWAFKLSGEY